VAVTPDGGYIITGSDDKTARVWDAHTGAQLGVLGGHEWEVTAVAVTPDGGYIITGSSGYAIVVWDARSLTRVRELNHFRGVSSIAISADGDRMATGADDGTVDLWDIRSGSQLKELGPHGIGIKDVVFTPDGSRIVAVSGDRSKNGAWLMESSARDYRVRIWDLTTSAELKVFKATSSVMSVAVTPDGSRILTGLQDGTVRIWRSQFDASVLTLSGHSRDVDAVGVTADGRHIITGSLDDTARVWDAHTGAEVVVLKGHEAGISSVAASPDGARIVTGSTDGTARIWDSAGGIPLAVLRGEGDWITGVAVTPDGSRIITSSGYYSGRHFSTKQSVREKVARIWDAQTGKVVKTLVGHGQGVTSVAVTGDGRRVITGSIDGTARIWDADTGTELMALRGERSNIVSVAVTPDGSRVVTGAWSGVARVWDALTGAQVLELHGHDSLILGVAISPDGTRIVTGSVDRTARVWDAMTGVELAVLKGHTQGITSVAVTPGGTHIVTGSEDGTARIWELFNEHQSLIAQAKERVPRCLTPTQRKQYYLAPGPPHWCVSMRKWPYDPPSALIEGRRLLQNHNDDEANVLFAAALETDPQAATGINAAWADAYIDRGGDMARTGSEDRAYALFIQALKLDHSAGPKINQTWANAKSDYGNALLGELKDDQANAVFKEAVTRDPSVAIRIDQTWSAAYTDRATNMLQLGKNDDARKFLSEAVKRHPSADAVTKIAQTYNEIAWKLFLKGNSSEGLADSERAVALAPNKASYLDTRGQIYLALGRIEAGCGDLKKSTEIGIRSPGTYYGLGSCTEKLGQIELAIQAYRKALELDGSGDDYEEGAKLKAKQRLEALVTASPPRTNRAIERRP
jgi:WD40 repeat protein/tetratricopeptide (TPR) repeat protein